MFQTFKRKNHPSGELFFYLSFWSIAGMESCRVFGIRIIDWFAFVVVGQEHISVGKNRGQKEEELG
jgi:hypothetical protein